MQIILINNLNLSNSNSIGLNLSGNVSIQQMGEPGSPSRFSPTANLAIISDVGPLRLSGHVMPRSIDILSDSGRTHNTCTSKDNKSLLLASSPLKSSPTPSISHNMMAPQRELR